MGSDKRYGDVDSDGKWERDGMQRWVMVTVLVVAAEVVAAMAVVVVSGRVTLVIVMLMVKVCIMHTNGDGYGGEHSGGSGSC